MKIKLTVLILALALFSIACAGQPEPEQGTDKPAAGTPVVRGGSITMATTTSTNDSGLLDYLNPIFTKKTGIDVRVVSMGTGAAIKAGENGDADLILVHHRDGELAFVKDGYGLKRREIFYNDFIILGPADNPAGVAKDDPPGAALAKIAGSGAEFISRGDDSGTHRKEQVLWKASGIPVEESIQTLNKSGKEVTISCVKPSGDWYLMIGQGMAAAITMAYEKDAYLLADRGTYLSYMSEIDLQIVNEGDPTLVNQYGIIAVNPAKHEGIKYDLAMEYIDWICTDEGQKAVGDFRVNGEVLFYPNYKGE